MRREWKLGAVFVDTRTPKEYEEATIPNAVNIPLFSNEERAVVGTIYKKIGKNEAIEKGMEFVSKHLPNMLKEFNKYKGKKIVIFCCSMILPKYSLIFLRLPS